MIERYKWNVAGCFGVMLLCLYPQIVMWVERGRDWNGAYVQVNGDEWLYSAYIQALIDGRPRKNDPYTGRDDSQQTPQPESVFSIQFVPAYVIAVPARLLGISASFAFIALGIIVSLTLCLTLGWLVNSVGGAKEFGISAAIFTICFGGFAANVGLVGLWSDSGQYYFLPFMRRYEPAAMIPVFFLFCGFTLRALRADGRVAFRWALLAGLSVGVLLFSYLYLWTMALAWLFCLGFLWFGLHRQTPRTLVVVLSTIVTTFGLAMVPYLWLVSKRSSTLTVDQKLSTSHAPDLLRMPELIAMVAVLLLALFAIRKRVNLRQPEIIISLSFLVAPFVVFNQQIITGKSLQPFHFQMFIGNYVVLIGVAMLVLLTFKAHGWNKDKIGKAAVWIALISLWWASIEVLIHTKVILKESKFIDSVAGVGRHLRQQNALQQINLRSRENPRPLVLTTDYDLAISLPTFAPQAVLWSPNFDFINLTSEERRDRLFEFLYLSGISVDAFKKALLTPMSTMAAVTFGHERVLPDLAVNVAPIAGEEIHKKVGDYEQFCRSFDREIASKHALSYLIVPASGANLENLDRWYERDRGEKIEDWIVYAVKLRS